MPNQGVIDATVKIALDGFDTAQRQLDSLGKGAQDATKNVTQAEQAAQAAAGKAQGDIAVTPGSSVPRQPTSPDTSNRTKAQRVAAKEATKSAREVAKAEKEAERAAAKRAKAEKVAAQEAAKAAAERAKAQQDYLSKVGNVGKAITVAFAAASATMLSLVKAADPVRFAIFQDQLKITAILIGRLFIPILKDLIRFVNRVNVALSQMTTEQKEGAAKWGKWGLIITAVGAALAFVAKAVMFVFNAFSTLWGVVSPLVRGIVTLVRVLGRILPIGKIVKLLALAFLLLNSEGGRLGEMFGRLKAAALPVLEQMWKIAGQLWDAFTELAGLVGDIMDDIFDTAGSGLLDVFEELIPIIVEGLNMVKTILEVISDAIREVMSTIREAKAIYSVLREKKASEIPKAVAQGVGRAIVNDAERMADKVLDIFGGGGKETTGAIGDFLRDDVIGGKEDEDKMIEERERLETGAGDFSGDKGAGGSFDGKDDSDPFKPMMPTQQVQTFGVEEAFKKAQEGATFDPTKASEMIIALLASQGKLSEELVRNTARPALAGMAF